jgi:hypothetical protein
VHKVVMLIGNMLLDTVQERIGFALDRSVLADLTDSFRRTFGHQDQYTHTLGVNVEARHTM